MAIHKTRIIILTTFMIYTLPVIANSDIASCVDKNGNITYTDILCFTVNELPPNAQLGLVAKDRAMNKAPSVYEPFPLNEPNTPAEPLADTKLDSITKMAQSECVSRFDKYFKRTHPSANNTPPAEFTNIVDQFENGNKLSVSLSSLIEYSNETATFQSTVECTVQNINGGVDWIVGFIEK